MFGIGHWEFLLIALVLFILFGHRLPSIMRHLGRGTIAFRNHWADSARFRPEPNTLWPTSLADWLVILMFVLLLIALFLPAWAWSH